MVRPASAFMEVARQTKRPWLIERAEFVVTSGAAFVHRDPGDDRGYIICTHSHINRNSLERQDTIARQEQTEKPPQTVFCVHGMGYYSMV